jgi:hypothetical protein
MSCRYFNLNIRHPEYAKLDANHPSAAQYWLDKRKLAPIFYGTLSVDHIKTKVPAFLALGNSCSDIENFIAVGDSYADVENKSILVTIDEGYVWFYTADKTVRMMDEDDESLVRGNNGQDLVDWPKAFRIKLLDKKHVKDVPLVLSSMKSNQWMTRGTFREIEPIRGGAYLGNIAAIQSVLNEWQPNFKLDPLDCLSSLEFETLIAKILEEHGCFVPAYKGGFLKDVDLIAKPTKTKSIAGMLIKVGQNFAFQLKLSLDRKLLNDLRKEKVNYLIGLNDDESLTRNFANSEFHNLCLGRTWLRKALKESPCASKWLDQSLEWLPLKNRSCDFRPQW